jgi:DNA-directed RNA polymerase specialized sigma24 family protein
VVAARMKEMGAALAALDPVSRALLDLSMRRGLKDEEIAAVLNVPTEDVTRRREELLDGLAQQLGLDGREERDELFASLPDLPDSYWRGQSARA